MAEPMLGNEMRQVRTGRDMDQQQFADWLNSLLDRKYDKARVNRWEAGGEAIPQHVARELRRQIPNKSEGIPVAVATGPAIVIAVSLQKGGVSKTTTSVNLAFLLSQRGKRVLLVDSDPQGSATVSVGEDPHGLELAKRTLTAILDPNADRPTRDAVSPVCDGAFDLLGASIALSEIELNLMSDPTASLALREKLSEVSGDYDFIVVDTPPNLGLLTAGALGAADLVLIPSQTEQLSLMGIPLLMRTIDRTKRRVNRRLRVLGILPTHYNARTVVDRHMLEELQTIATQHGITLFPPIGRTVAYKEAVLAGRPALDRTPDISGVESYNAIASALLDIANARKEEAHEPQ